MKVNLSSMEWIEEREREGGRDEETERDGEGERQRG